MPVKVTTPSGEQKTYEKAAVIERDGNSDWIYKDSSGNIVATRRNATVEENEVL